MRFTYIKTVGSVYSEEHDEYFDDTEEIDYEVSDFGIQCALGKILAKEFFDGKEETQKNIQDFLEQNPRVQEILAEDYYDILKDYFEDEAREQDKCR